ncbi:MAG: heat-inducible transcriptional repressor HrcA [Candidatus Reconcilbacillus cellulovorans]|uniref:Heat-inducible transcription repressor HrcA n=1 Tax=Candidatus Reconcilbacillus cellulovorans TaxID=1906605 RepID=A0A2A6DXR4_9BACL|nr:MAG: heat-inducible transcriptional repressor HrcA [Candidatus Reconcilbacillus cellulovorans]
MLTERQKLILGVIVDDYIRSAEPVGSRTISKRGTVGFSPATIRNEMSDLEELGYLEQPHTSAGRIPSQKGYRYYVDHLLKHVELSDEVVRKLKAFFAERLNRLEDAMQQAAQIVARLTNYTAIVLGPEVFHAALRHLQIVPLNDRKAVAVIVTDTGHVENRLVDIPEDMSASDLEKAVNFLNAKLTGVPLFRFKTRLYSEIAAELSRYVSRYEELCRMIEDVLENDHADRVYLSGTTHMLNQPEFRDVEKVRRVFDLLESTPELIRLMSPSTEGIQVRIGEENSVEAINQCSLITATYSVDGRIVGAIGVLGPTRMEYGRVIAFLERFSEEMARLLSQWYR